MLETAENEPGTLHTKAMKPYENFRKLKRLRNSI